MANTRGQLFWEILLAIILPPLCVALKYGCCSCAFWICLLLTLLGYIPGIIYAICTVEVMNRDKHPYPPYGFYDPPERWPEIP